MPSINQLISGVSIEDEKFIGTVAFKSEGISLPDGSKMALGIDDGRWLLVYQKPKTREFVCYEYNSHDRRLLVDKNAGTSDDLGTMKRLIAYFFESADVDDLVTILPPKVYI